MENVTADQVKAAITEHSIKFWKLRECSMCGHPLRYEFNGDSVCYHAACNCVTYHEPPRPSSYGHIADTLNMQTPEIRARMWNEMLSS